MALTIRAIQHELERLAPPALAESWDNVGLLAGDPQKTVATVLVALDATAGVLEQAAARNAELLVVHHPLIFTGLKRLVEDGGIVSLLSRLIREQRGLLALHTNLDSAPGGLNQYVGTLLDLRKCRPLIPTAARPLLKLVVYVPESHVDAVRAVICRAGAGQIGRYAECTFGAVGTGTFRPEEGTSPYIGTPGGGLERVTEVRLETVVPRAALGPVLAAVFSAHPYEEVAYDLIPLDNAWPGAGLGCIGELAAPLTAGDFLAQVRAVLHAERATLIGDAARPVNTVALCTGAGSDFLEYARGAGADLYLTGEVKHHVALLARQQGIAVIDAGHFPTERPVVDLLADYLTAHFPQLTVVKAEENDPFGTEYM